MARSYEQDAAEYLEAVAVALEARTLKSVRPDHPTRLGDNDHPIAAQVTIRRGLPTAPGTERPVVGGKIVLVDSTRTSVVTFGEGSTVGKIDPLTRRTGDALGIKAPRSIRRG